MHHEQHFETRLWNLAQGEPDQELERHLATCEQCQEELVTLRQLVLFKQVAGGPFATPPAALTASLSGLMSRIRPDLGPQPTSSRNLVREKLRLIRAALLLDSGGQFQVAGLRSDPDQRVRQLAYVSDVADLDLEITKSNQAFLVVGQLGMDTVPSGLRIRFVRAGEDPLASASPDSIEAAVSAGGYFQLTVSPGEWVAAVDIDDAVVIFPDVRL